MKYPSFSWLDEFPCLGENVMDQGDAWTCWAKVVAIVVGFLWHLKSKREGTWARLSSQDLINRVIKFNPKIVKKDGKKDAVDDNGCYGCDVRWGYIYCGKFGICFENVCTYTGMRDDTVSAEPNENEVPRIRIEKFEWLGSTTNKKERINILEALLYRCPLVGSILATKKFKSHKSGVLMSLGKRNEKDGHRAIVIIGYDSDTESFQILNCRGSDWGKDGTGIGYVKCDLVENITMPVNPTLIETISNKRKWSDMPKITKYFGSEQFAEVSSNEAMNKITAFGDACLRKDWPTINEFMINLGYIYDNGAATKPTDVGIMLSRSLTCLIDKKPLESLKFAIQAQVVFHECYVAYYLQACSLFALGRETEGQNALEQGTTLENLEKRST